MRIDFIGDRKAINAVNPTETTAEQGNQEQPGPEQKTSRKSTTKENPHPPKTRVGHPHPQIRKKKKRIKGWLESIKEEQQWIAIERLAGVARGTALILENIWDDDLNDGRWHIVVQGLSEALRQYADEVDVLCFQSAGDLARSMHPHFLAEVLQKEMDVITLKDREISSVTA